MKVCKKWLLIQDGENGVLSASMKTTQTMSLPMWRFRCSCKWRKKSWKSHKKKWVELGKPTFYNSYVKFTFWWSFGSLGKCVDTWNMTSIPRQRVKIEYNPVKSCTVSSPPLYRSKPNTCKTKIAWKAFNSGNTIITQHNKRRFYFELWAQL